MAVHFSEEEKEKLEKNESAIYQEHSDEDIKKEIQNLSFFGKIKQFRDYYLKALIVAIVVVAIVAVQIYDTANKDKVLLFISIQGDAIDDNSTEALEQELNRYLGYKDKETVRISLDSDTQQIQTYLYSGTTDILIAPEEDFKKWGAAGYFYAANQKVESTDQKGDADDTGEETEVTNPVTFYYDYPEQYRVYTQFLSGEDVRKNLKDTNYVPSDKTQYYSGVSLKDSEKYKAMGGMIPDAVAGISCETKHIEDATAIMKYLMDNSIKWKGKNTTKKQSSN